MAWAKIANLKGPTGSAGATGATGAAGVGIQGVPGPTGATGPVGPVAADSRVDYVSGTTGSGSTTHIAFNPAYTSVRAAEVQQTWIGSQMITGAVSNLTTTGCDVTVMRSRSTLLLSTGPFEAAPAGTVFRVLVIGS